MHFTIFASGSSGNCALVSQGDTHILVDAGISARRIQDCLAHWGLSVQDLTALVVTHPHSDHISGLATLSKHSDFPICATQPVALQLCYRLAIEHRVHTFLPGKPFDLGGLAVLGIPTRHDTPGSVGYRFTGPGGESSCIVTDLGVVTREGEAGVAGCALAVIESNHDLDSLHSGPYPYSLQARVAGDEGHLCNEDGAALCAHAARNGAHTVVLAHLSRQNNSPGLARRAAERALSQFPEVKIQVAPVLCQGLRIEV